MCARTGAYLNNIRLQEPRCTRLLEKQKVNPAGVGPNSREHSATEARVGHSEARSRVRERKKERIQYNYWRQKRTLSQRTMWMRLYGSPARRGAVRPRPANASYSRAPLPPRKRKKRTRGRTEHCERSRARGGLGVGSGRRFTGNGVPPVLTGR